MVRSLAGFHESVDDRFNQALADMASGGAEIVDDLSFPEYPEGFSEAAYDLLLMPTVPMKATPLPGPGASRAEYVQRALEMIVNTCPFDITRRWRCPAVCATACRSR